VVRALPVDRVVAVRPSRNQSFTGMWGVVVRRVKPMTQVVVVWAAPSALTNQ
jgi:hypothetical protein